MLDGRIVREGGPELADELEDKGYEFVREEVAASAGLASSRSAARRRSRPTSASRCPPGAARASGPRRCASSSSTRSSRAATSRRTSCRRSCASTSATTRARRPDRAARRQRDLRGRRPTERITVDLARAGGRGAPRAGERVLRQAPARTTRASSPPPPPPSGPAARSCTCPRTSQLEKPIQVVYLIDEPGTAQYAHTLAVVGEHAECRIREYCLGARLRGPGAARRRLRAVRAARRPGATWPTTRTGAGRGVRHLHQAGRDRAATRT